MLRFFAGVLVASIASSPAPALEGSPAARVAEVRSPDGRVVVTFAVADVGESKGCPVWGVRYGERTVISPSRLGLEVEGAPLLDGLEVVSESASSEDRTWRPVYGERSLVRDRCRQVSLELRRAASPGRRLRIDLRAYDEGAAFRYVLPALEGDGAGGTRGGRGAAAGGRDAGGAAAVRIAAERSEFRAPGDPAAWAVYSAQGNYEKVPLSAVKPGCERPLVIRLADDLYAALGEAGLVDFARMKFAPLRRAEGAPSGSGAGVVSSLGSPVEASLPATSPWRFVLVAESAGGLLERNDLLLNLNEPCEIEDPSWIRPGKVIREVTLSTVGGKACVDFAAEHGLQYVEYDAGWYGPEDSDEADATTVSLDPRRSKGPLDLPEVIRHARERGIGILLYVNRKALERQLDAILPLYREWGIAGVKYGFVQVGSQRWTSSLHEAVRKAAAHRLMVDIHDEYRPTGWSRTYPNLLTQEGIAGDETKPSNELTLTILFTRMIAGAGDNTICYYDRRVDENASHAYQLAKAVCLYSPWQFLFWYDRPLPRGAPVGPDPLPANVIGDEPELEFFAEVPTVWDETRVVHGEIGEYAVIARRSGERWFVGCMNAVRDRTLQVPLDFLEKGREYLAHVYADDPSVPTRTRVRIDRVTVDAGTVLEAPLAARGGRAIRIEPAAGLRVVDGWYVTGDSVVWGNAQYNGWWGAYRTSIVRRAPGRIGPNLTEDLPKLADAMLAFGYPGFEHNYGLWYDRRRDAHDVVRRTDASAVPPFLEGPWARSGTGQAWDGLSLYDLERYDDWYFGRLDEFAEICDRKGTILLHSFYMQHALLETECHYVDFPWRPVNCVQDTGMPDRIPAANAFYDVSHPVRRRLHEAYIEKCLDVLGRRRNVIFLCSQEYTGPRSFLEFWMDRVARWEDRNGRRVHLALGATKDVLDAVLADPERSRRASSVDLRYWWYLPDGSLRAPEGGREAPGRYASGADAAKTTPEQIHRQVLEYRRRYPGLGILHMINASREQTWAFLLGGGSLLVRYLEYADRGETAYVAPDGSEPVRVAHEFVRKHVGRSLPRMAPADVVAPAETTWCLAERGREYLVYALRGGAFTLDLSGAEGEFRARWLDPRTGALSDAAATPMRGGGPVRLVTPDATDWALWVRQDPRVDGP